MDEYNEGQAQLARLDTNRWFLLLAIILAGLIIVALIVSSSSALSHDHGPGSWINQQSLRDPVSGENCCNLNDCQPDRSVRAVAGGYIVETGELVPAYRVLWRSQDGAWWRCRVMGGANVNATRCLIGPPSGS